MRLRSVARWTANTLGYFWLPCPLCGQEFGGHEWADIAGHTSSIPDPDMGPGYGIGICPDCTAAGQGCYVNIIHDPEHLRHACELTRAGLTERLGAEQADKLITALRETA